MGRILSVVSNQLTLATDLRDSQEIIPTLQPGTITPVQAINCFV
jgi:F0F1-type ATP synthase beta subunit